MTDFFSPLSPKSKAKNKTKVISKNKARNKTRNDADNKTKSRNIQKTVVNVIVPDHDNKNDHHHGYRRFW